MRGGGPAQGKGSCELESKPCLHRVPEAGWGRPRQRSGLSSPSPVDFGVCVDMPFKGACARTVSSLWYAVISPCPSQDAAHAI